jgi:predicted nucleic acid-binding protein
MAPDLIASSIVAVCDACVLYPFHQRNILVQAAVDGIYSARWTDEIHDEWTRNLLANIPEIPPQRLQQTRRLMEMALPDARITGFHHHIDGLNLPDPQDRHVVAAAIKANASLILTWNLRDFPASALKEHALECLTPDAFLASLYDRTPELIVATLSNARRNLSKSGVSALGFLDILMAHGLTELAARLREHSRDL